MARRASFTEPGRLRPCLAMPPADRSERTAASSARAGRMGLLLSLTGIEQNLANGEAGDQDQRVRQPGRAAILAHLHRF